MAYSASTDPHLLLRRIERQHALIEALRARRGQHTGSADLAQALGVTTRTVERDVARLRHSGIPVTVQRGPGGGYAFAVRTSVEPIALEPGEVAALIVSLVALGPTATESARTAMDKLVTALAGADPVPMYFRAPRTEGRE